MKNNIEVEFLMPNQYKKYKTELISIFNENFFRNGGMLYSDDFLVNSSFIIIAKSNSLIVAYMAISFDV